MLLSYKSIACAVYLRELVIFVSMFHIVAINHYKSIKSIDNNLYQKITDAKSKQNYKLSTRYASEVKEFNNLSNKNMACAVYLQELLIFYIYISHCCYRSL